MKSLKLTFCLLSFLFFASALRAQQPGIDSLRARIFALRFDSGKADKLLKELELLDHPSPSVLAYEAACKAHMAKISKNIFKKYTLIKAANRDLQAAVLQDKSNPEIRFLRYAIQVQTPYVLGFSKNLDEDRRVMLASLSGYAWKDVDEHILNYIVYFLQKYGQLSNTESQYLQTQLASR